MANLVKCSKGPAVFAVVKVHDVSLQREIASEQFVTNPFNVTSQTNDQITMFCRWGFLKFMMLNEVELWVYVYLIIFLLIFETP